ncbi:hypothetical protein [Paraburkholderia ultramafica]|nr:hypothetical protein [Paraburkholderia ultramafica]
MIAAAPLVGDSQNLTPSSTRSQLVGMLGLVVAFRAERVCSLLIVNA